MYFFLILFFISLGGIILMIGRKLMLADLKKNKLTEKILLESFDLNEIKYVTVKKAKKYGLVILITTLRISILSSHLARGAYKNIKGKVKNVKVKYLKHKQKEVKIKEASHFLKMVTDYKHKVKQIKHKIKKEEGIE